MTARRAARRGSTLPMTAVCVVGLFAFTALAVDLGMVMVARTECQNASDAAALAGARQLNTVNATTNNQPAALIAAGDTAAQNPYLNTQFQDLGGSTATATAWGATSGRSLASGQGTGAVGARIATGAKVFNPEYVSSSSKLYQSLLGKNEMLAWGLDLSKTPIHMIGESFGKGLIYALIVVVLGALYFLQQKMVAARAAAAPNMSETQQKIMQYLPVVFAVFLVFYLTGLVIYYMAQAIFRIALQAYITRRFYRGEDSLGRQAQAAGDRAREIAKKDGNGGGGLFAQAKREMSAGKAPQKAANSSTTVSKRVTPPKNRPTPTGRAGRPAPSGKVARPGSTQRPTKKK